MADEDRRAVLAVEHVVRRLDVAVERQCLVLQDADVEAVRLQQFVDPLPAGAVDEAPVNQDHVSYVCHGDLPFAWSSSDEVDIGHPHFGAAALRARASTDGTFRGSRTYVTPDSVRLARLCARRQRRAQLAASGDPEL